MTALVAAAFGAVATLVSAATPPTRTETDVQRTVAGPGRVR
ncbi:hypothetical protein [Kibdelosporangium aridum]|nr:hypothetical protein [Kibdelosporangium aridum]